MCSTPSVPSVSSTKTETVAAPTYADASVTKAGQKTASQTASLAGKDIKTSARGIKGTATTEKAALSGSALSDVKTSVRGLTDTALTDKKSLLGN